MTINQLKRALALLTFLKYDDLSSLKSDITNTYQPGLDSLKDKQKKSLIRSIKNHDIMSNTIDTTNINIDDEFSVDQMPTNINGLSEYLSKYNKNYSERLLGIAKGFGLEFNGNVFSVPQNLKTRLNNYTGDNVEIIVSANADTVMKKISNSIKIYIKQTEQANQTKDVNNNINKKFNKIIKSKAMAGYALCELSNELDKLLEDITNAETIISTAIGSTNQLDIDSYINNKSFSEIRSDLNV